MSQYNSIKNELNLLKNDEKIAVFKRFFKTGLGQYGEGDQFIGLTVPQQRVIAKKYANLANLDDINTLLQSAIHEFRFTGLLILTYQYPKTDEFRKTEIFDFYLKHKDRINNWDLVDVTCPMIMGDYLFHHTDKLPILDKLIRSQDMWDRRKALLATYYFIKRDEFDLILRFATYMLDDKRDLIQKASGWMLREMGKRNLKTLTTFLDQHAQSMPRTMLRYAIEKLPSNQKDHYMGKQKPPVQD